MNAPRLKLERVCVSFAGLKAVSEVSFELGAGEICAVIGPNGAGKSTLFNAIGGYVRVTGGNVVLEGHRVTGLPVHRIAAAGVRRSFQNGGLFLDMTVLENVMVGLHQIHAIPLYAQALALPSARRREREAIARARDVLGLMGIANIEEAVLRDLSSGQQRLVEIARAIATPAKVLMLDEPAVGLTPQEVDRLDDVLRMLARQGISVLLVEHVLDLVMSVSDKVVVLNYGQLLADGRPDDVRNNPAVLEAYLGQGGTC